MSQPVNTPDRNIDGAPTLVFKRLNETDIGQMIETDNLQKGILIAPAFQHLDRLGHPIGPVFDYFAAPRNTRFLQGSKEERRLVDTSTSAANYETEIDRIASLKDEYGHNGILLPEDFDIFYAATKDPEKLALWHMPVLSLVNGNNVFCDAKNPNNMFAHKDKGALKRTFNDNSADAHFKYWTASTPAAHETGCRHVVSFADGTNYSEAESKWFLSRAVRAEIRPKI